MFPQITPALATTDGFSTAAWWVAAIVGVLVLLLLIQILGLRWLLGVRRKRADRFSEIWEPTLALSVVEVPDQLPAIEPSAIPEFLMLWNYLQESLRDEARARLTEVARRVGADTECRRMVRDGDVRDKLIALTALGHMRDRELWDEMTALLAGDDPVVSLCAARALIRIDAEGAAAIVVEQLARRPDWPTATVAGILREAGPGAISELLSTAVRHADVKSSPRLIKLLELAYSEVAAPVVHDILEKTDSTDVVIACLRIVNDPGSLDRIRELAGDERWQVRVHAAQALGRLGTEDDEGRLIDALADPQWWVRYRAAQALVDLPLTSLDHLRQLSHTLDDRFGRDMLRQVIAEKELAC